MLKNLGRKYCRELTFNRWLESTVLKRIQKLMELDNVKLVSTNVRGMPLSFDLNIILKTREYRYIIYIQEGKMYIYKSTFINNGWKLKKIKFMVKPIRYKTFPSNKSRKIAWKMD